VVCAAQAARLPQHAQRSGRQATLYELLPPQLHGLFYVGRLDYDSEGLVLLTNDGDTAHRLLHPRYGVEREYEVELDRNVDAELPARLEAGVMLEDGAARAQSARSDGHEAAAADAARGPQARGPAHARACGHDVRRLRRTRYGPIRLGDLEPGAWRALERGELQALRRSTRSTD
jgi:23S rRNA pseudouridine2605 synthase